MAFRIHAAGSNGFRYERDNNPDNDIFEAASVISTLISLEPSVSGAVGLAADQITPSVSTSDVVRAGANITFITMLRDAVDMLATNRRAHGGWISVAPRQTHTLWPDTSGFVRFDFYSDESSAGSEFIRAILPQLVATELNNYGVFRALALAITRYHTHIGDSATPMLLIHLSH